MSSLCRRSTPSGGSIGFGARADGRTARWAHEKALLEQTYFPQPRDEDDVRVEAQWQEHVCRSNLVSGVPARVEGRGAAESLPWGSLGFLGQLAGCGVFLSCCFTQTHTDRNN